MIHDAADLERVFAEQLRAVAKSLSDLGAEYMLIDGLAVGIWSEPRATKDADLSVHVLAAPDRVRDALAVAGLEVARGDLSRALERGEAVRLKRRAASPNPSSSTCCSRSPRSRSTPCDGGATSRYSAWNCPSPPRRTSSSSSSSRVDRRTWPMPPCFSTSTGGTSTSSGHDDGAVSSASRSVWRHSRSDVIEEAVAT